MDELLFGGHLIMVVLVGYKQSGCCDGARPIMHIYKRKQNTATKIFQGVPSSDDVLACLLAYLLA